MIVRSDNGKVVEFEEGKYGMLMMVVCDREGRVYDVWISFGSVHEGKKAGGGRCYKSDKAFQCW